MLQTLGLFKEPEESDLNADDEILKDKIRRQNLIHLNRTEYWQWYVDLLRERQHVIDAYKKSSPKALATKAPEKCDTKRSVLPFPATTSGEYGWLASKKEFRLETYNLFHESSKLVLDQDAYSSESFPETQN